MANNSIIEKIRKILALAKGAGTQEEAQAAFLHAQRLMAKYHLGEGDVAETTVEEPIKEGSLGRHQQKPWLRQIFRTVGAAFRCRCAWLGTADKFGRVPAVYFGEETDVALATMIFEQAVEAAKSLGMEHKEANATAAKNPWWLYFSYLEGFASGLEAAFKKQTDADDALLVISRVPERVDVAYEGFKRRHGLCSMARAPMGKAQAGAYGAGQADGRQFGGDRKGVRTSRTTTVRGYLN